MAKGIGSGRIPRFQTGEEEEGVVSDRGREAGTMECVCDELGKGNGRLCRVSIDRYCRRKRSEKVEPRPT